MSSGIGFKPSVGLIALAIPQAFYEESKIELMPQVLKKKEEEYITSGKEMIVAAIGAEVERVKVGDLVLMRAAPYQQVEIEDSKYIVARQSDVLGFLD